MSIRKMAFALVVALAAIGSSVAVATPASAVNTHAVGHPGAEWRCDQGGYNVCLYYSTNTNGAYWGAGSWISDLAPYQWFAGSGSASNPNVKNNSNYMFCTLWTQNQCFSYWGEYWSGDYDYEAYGNIGQLWFTINDNASLSLS